MVNIQKWFLIESGLKFILYDLSTFVLKNLRQLFDKYAVARTKHDALVKSTTMIFFKFCGLLRKPKLYVNVSANLIGSTHVKKFIDLKHDKKCNG